MRFNVADWLRLILACIAASAAMAVLSWAVWNVLGFPRSLYVGREVALALSLLAIPLNAMAAWPVLRDCVRGLERAPWLTEAAVGAVLGGIVSLPTLVHLVLVPGGAFPTSAANVPGVGWLPPLACAVAALFPPGLLLQRLTGISAWPSLIVVATGMAATDLVWGRSPTQLLLPYAMLLTQTFLPGQMVLGTAITAVIMSGMLSGLCLGAGLFLMARAGRPAER